MKKKGEVVSDGKMRNGEKIVEDGCKHGKSGRSGIVSHGKLSCVMWWITGWAGLNSAGVLSSVCFKLKQNPVPQFPHLPKNVRGILVLVVLL